MSSDILARVNAFYEKASEMNDKGYLLRAAEIFARAAKLARELGVDNIALLHLQLLQCNMLTAYALNAPKATADPRILAAHRAESIVLLFGAVEGLERRRAAGTLLDGKCAAVEEAWCVGL